MKSNLQVLAAQKSQREGRRITLRTVALENNLSRYTVYAIADNSISEYPKSVLETLCAYFGCDIGDLLTLEDVSSA